MSDVDGGGVPREVATALAQLRSALAEAPIPIIVHAEDGEVLHVSRSWTELTGYALSEVPTFDAWINGAYGCGGQAVRDHVCSVFSGTEPKLGVDFAVGTKDGSVRYWSFSASAPRPLPDGRRFVVGMAVDVTERTVSAQAALEAERHRNEFLATLSHELRNPLTPIKNSLYVLKKAAPASEQAENARATIERQVGQLTRLVDDLLDVTRLTRGKLRIDKRRLDLAAVVRQTAEDHRAPVEHAGLTLEVACCPGPLWVDGDAVRIAQAIGNLLGNAAKFTPEGGKVAVVLETDGATATLRVRDSGVGIAKEHLGALFDPFVQADRTLDRSRGGLGLGLALVKGVVELHGGAVRAESEGLGRGAELVVTLPYDDDATSERRTMPSDRPPRRRILVIEDDVDSADSLKDLLELGGHEVLVAYAGPEGIAKARTLKPDVVLCDIGLPGMSGHEVARALRAEPSLLNTSIVALTGYATEEDQRRALEAGFHDHIAKPPTLERLDEVLARG
jgi:PAS domain S-box-containing protein